MCAMIMDAAGTCLQDLHSWMLIFFVCLPVNITAYKIQKSVAGPGSPQMECKVRWIPEVGGQSDIYYPGNHSVEVPLTIDVVYAYAQCISISIAAATILPM